MIVGEVAVHAPSLIHVCSHCLIVLQQCAIAKGGLKAVATSTSITALYTTMLNCFCNVIKQLKVKCKQLKYQDDDK